MTTPDRDYRFPPEPFRADWNREIADAIFGSIGSRLRTLEAKRNELQALIDDLSFNGQARIDEAITPLIVGVRNEVTALETAVGRAVSEAADAATAVASEANRRIAKVELDLDAIEAAFAQILAGGVGAASVTESAQRVFVTPEQRAEIGALRTDLDDLERNSADAAAAARRFSFAMNLHMGA